MKNVSSTQQELRLSIIIPAYNEEKRLPGTLEKLFGPDAHLCEPFEIVVVDDGSKDHTRDIVRDAARVHPELRLIENPHSGKAFTVRTGILAARGRFCLHADADLSTPPAEFARLIAALEQGNDGAIGSRAGRPGAPGYRLLMSNTWRWFVSLLAIRGYRDTQCGFKAYRTEAARHILERSQLYNTPGKSLQNPSVTAAADVEILVVARKLGYRVVEVPLEWNHCEDTKIRPVGDSLQGIRDLLKIRWYAIRGAYNLPLNSR